MFNGLEDKLSKEQIAPIEKVSKSRSILAAAGSGKTRTLVYMIVADLAAGVPPESIVAFTFTEKAAEELLARVHSLAKERIPNISLDDLYIGTIHSWCLQYLANQSNFYNFTPLDELHVDALSSRLYDFLELENTYGLAYPKAIPNFLADIEILYNENLSLSAIPESIRGSISKFLDVLRFNKLMTFGGMIRYAIEELETSGPVEQLQTLYVDEYQDVNPAQVALIQAMLPENNSKLIVVGDDLQCIYNWRGSDVSRILNFAHEFEDPRVFRLSTNYRSREDIIFLGNAVAENIALRDKEKVMKPGRAKLDFPSVYWLSLNTEEEEVQTVVSTISNLLQTGVPPQKIAVLLRSVIGSGQAFVSALQEHDIPVYCPVLSRGGAFLEGFVLPIVEWLSKEHLEPRNEIEEEEAERRADSLWNVVNPWLPEINDYIFWGELDKWRVLIEEQSNDAYNVRDQLYRFLDSCSISLAPEDNSLAVGLGIASQIIRSVEEIHRRRLSGQQRRSPRGIMSEIYYALRRNQQSFGESLPVEGHVDGVLITTVHQAKGLEWPIVILPVLMKNRFPVRRRGHGTRFSDDVAGRYGTSIEDERRLFYVAVTRARERLFLFDSAKLDGSKRSTFLTELAGSISIFPSNFEDIDPRVWTIPPSDLLDSDPPPIRIGLSDLLIHVECPYQFALRRVVGIQPSVGDELGFGKGLHELIQRRFEDGKGWTGDDLHIQVNENVNLPYMSEGSEEISRKAIEKRIIDLEELGVFDAEVESEIGVEIVLKGGVVHGIIDSIQVNDDGSILVRDWKSNIHTDFLPRYERQLQFYTHALRAQGRNVVKADLVDVAASVENKKLVTHEIDISESTITNVVHLLEQSLQMIATSDFQANPSELACNCCDMYRICSVRYKDESVW